MLRCQVSLLLDWRCFRMNFVVMCFRCTSKVKWIGCASVMFTRHHRLADSKWIVVSVGVTQGYTALKKIDTSMMLKDCSEACPTSTVGCRYMSKLSAVAHCDYCLAMLYHSFRPSENKPLYPQRRCKSKTERSSITHATSQAKEQANNPMVDVS